MTTQSFDGKVSFSLSKNIMWFHILSMLMISGSYDAFLLHNLNVKCAGYRLFAKSTGNIAPKESKKTVKPRKTSLYPPLDKHERTISWLDQWNQIVRMRSSMTVIGSEFENLIAEVDTMGAKALADASGSGPAEREYRYSTLIGTMLSPQTKDKATSEAYHALRALVAAQRLPFLPSSVLRLYSEDIEAAIRPVSFYHTKTKNIMASSKLCVDNHGDDIPDRIDDLLSFPGVVSRHFK